MAGGRGVCLPRSPAICLPGGLGGLGLGCWLAVGVGVADVFLADVGCAEDVCGGGVGGFVFADADFGVVEVQGGAFGADAGQGGEVVAWWWAGGGPFQGRAEAPGVVDGDFLA